VSIEQMQAELARLAALPDGEGMTLAPEFYTSEDWLGLERREIFRKAWICVGRADELPSAGDYRASEVDGAPIVVLRRKDGRLAAMSAVCLHRMAVIAEARGNAKGFTCPYHGWTYDLEGQLISAPRMPGSFDKVSRALPQFSVEEWNGFVYVNLDVTAEPISSRLRALERDLAPYHIERMRTLKHERHVWHTNWKVLVENFLEPYHLNVTHAATLARFALPSAVSILPRTDGYQFHKHRMLDEFKPVPLDPGVGIPNNDLSADQKQIAYIGGVFPSHMFSVTWDSVFWLALQPNGVNDVVVDVGMGGPFIFPPGQSPDPSHPNLYFLALFGAVNAEDRPRVEAVQRGAQSGLGRQSPLHPHEAPIGSFIAYLHAHLRQGISPVGGRR
jgi:phenylpropionate dioxygenase-like ring-hydroxylating dioxygenase large terminal subunit